MAKWLVQGPDAAAVLSRLSANHVDREVGRVVYTQWLDERGGIAADVTVTRQAHDRFCVVASDLIHHRVGAMVRRATLPGEVAITTDITSALTLLSVQGPSSRDLLSRLAECDLSNQSFPYLTGRHTHVGAAPTWMSRVTYVGELGYELHVPTDYATALYDHLMRAGAEFGIRPVGLSAMASLRLEKGYRDMGVDIDNTDTPLSAGLGFAIAWDKPGGFIGREALLQQRAGGPTVDRVVGLFVDDPSADLFGGESVFADGRWVGYVRAAAYGHTLGGPVALAQVSNPDGVTGQWLATTDFTVGRHGTEHAAKVQSAPFLDPTRSRILAD
jgi:4-methylaminobutanoate oxidase (formaldehyde-forming)